MANDSAAIVTVGMPVYNGAAFLRQAISSIQRQSFQRWQLLISDDCSTDDGPRLIERLTSTDPRITVIRQAKNLGHVENFRFLVDACRTPYFAWHCQDDWIDPNYLESLLAVFAAHPDCALACGDAKRVAVDGTILKHKPFPDLDRLDRAARVRLLLSRSEATRIFGLFRTEAIRGPFADALATGYVWGWDPLALLPFILGDQIRGTNETSFYWRDTGVSSDKYKPKTLTAEMRFLARWLDFHLAAWRRADLSLGEKLACLPALMLHIHERSGVSPYRRYVRPLLRAQWRRRC
jgi:Glycosyltransferases involved in cell wall biogenesis